MPTRLSGMDAAFLYLETPTTHMHVGGVIVADPATAPGGTLTRAEFMAYMASRLHLAPPFRRRLVPVPLGLDHPSWIEDPNFDLDFHVRRAALPAPGDLVALAEFASDVMSRPLDRARPLWELWVVEGLVAPDGSPRVALVTKTHHAAVDGVSGAELMAAILQTDPEQQAPPPTQEWRPEAVPDDLALVVQAGLRLATLPVGVLRNGRRALESLGAMVSSGPEPKDEPPPAPFDAPTMSWNRAIGPHRRVAFAELDLAQVKAVRAAVGGTVNDVVLAVVAGALRRFLLADGEPAEHPLVALVPISVRAGDEQLGNHVSAMLVGLPVDEPDPLRRLERITAGTADAKERHGAVGANTLQRLAEVTPGALSSLAARLYTRTRAADRHRPIWNVIVSNVPGPRIPLYCAGAAVEGLYPLGPVHEMNGLNITLFSYGGSIFVGLNADRDLLGDVGRLGGALVAALAELTTVAKGDR